LANTGKVAEGLTTALDLQTLPVNELHSQAAQIVFTLNIAINMTINSTGLYSNGYCMREDGL
jgi:hypothetical protein